MNLNLPNAHYSQRFWKMPSFFLKILLWMRFENGEEKMLPGLGVLFEVICKSHMKRIRQNMLQALENGLK